VRSPLLLEKTSTSIKTNNREYFHGLTRWTFHSFTCSNPVRTTRDI
jgi:hypothetical protein